MSTTEKMRAAEAQFRQRVASSPLPGITGVTKGPLGVMLNMGINIQIPFKEIIKPDKVPDQTILDMVKELDAEVKLRGLKP